MNAREVIARLGLEPHDEGGFFCETYRAAGEASGGDQGASSRDLASAIYYVLTPETFSEMHRLDADEVWHHYLGDPVEQLQLKDGHSKVVFLGNDLARGQRPQAVAPKGAWQGSRVLDGRHGFALLGTTMAPAFDFAGYENGRRADLIERYPDQRQLITALTHG